MWTTAPNHFSLVDSAKHRVAEAQDQVTFWTGVAERKPTLADVARAERRVWSRRLQDARDDLRGVQRQRRRAAGVA